MRRPGPPIVSRSFGATAARPSPHTAAVPPIAITARPTREFERHHRVEAPAVDARSFRPGWRVVAKLDALLERGLVEREAYQAAHEWCAWVAKAARLPAMAWAARVDISTVAGDAEAVHRLAAAGKVRQAAEALGPLRTKILEQVLLNDCPWAVLARLLRVSDKTAADRAAEAVNALCDWRAGRPVQPAPETRFRNQPSSW